MNWEFWIAEIVWQISRLFHRICCFLVGHKEILGDSIMYEPDWCVRCFMEWPKEEATLPTFLNRAYCWAVEHGWPEWLDLWLMKHVRLPKWWEY